MITKLLDFLNENVLIKNKTIISVDIQPEYEKFIPFLSDWVDFINENAIHNDIVFLYNGKYTVGDIDESEYISWLCDLGIAEDILNSSTFYDKGYAFFRYCMDKDIDKDDIVDLVKFMIKNDINNSRDIDTDMWDEFMIETNHTKQEIRELLEFADDCIDIPDLMTFLKNYDNIVLLGGSIDECLKEVEIALLSLDKEYESLQEFIY